MTIPHLLGRPTNLNHEFSASPQDKSTRRERVKFWIFWSPKMVHYTYSLKTIVVLFFFFFFPATTRLLQSCTKEVQKFSQNLLHGNQPTMGFWFLHQRGQVYFQVSNQGVCNVPPSLTAVECHEGYHSICWEDPRCLPTVVGPFLIKDNERERLT